MRGVLGYALRVQYLDLVLPEISLPENVQSLRFLHRWKCACTHVHNVTWGRGMTGVGYHEHATCTSSSAIGSDVTVCAGVVIRAWNATVVSAG